MNDFLQNQVTPIRTDVDMRPFNTLKLKSRAACAVSVTKGDQIKEAIEYAKTKKLNIVPLGEGSNVVLPPYWEVLCLQMKLRGISIIAEDADEIHIQVAAGERWHDLVKFCLNKGWHGLENMALIPGCCGAAPIQNIGAYGAEIGEFLTQVHLIERKNGQNKVVQTSDCGFGYRTSYFKNRWVEKYIVTAIDLKLSKVPKVKIVYADLQQRLDALRIQKPNPQDVFDAVCHLRNSKLPSVDKIGNVGSFFQNPTVVTRQFNKLVEKHPSIKGHKLSATDIRLAAAALLEICGWKGFREGDLGVYDKHALCLVNYGQADKKMIMELAEKMRADVLARFSIRLEIEPRIY